jgi:hypothetical protein
VQWFMGDRGRRSVYFVCRNVTSDLHRTSASLLPASIGLETAGSRGPKGTLLWSRAEHYCGEVKVVLKVKLIEPMSNEREHVYRQRIVK